MESTPISRQRNTGKRCLQAGTAAPTPGKLILAAGLLVAADAGDRLAGSSGLLSAPFDETAHLLSTLLIFWALPGTARKRFLVPALVASVAIDLDHVPAALGVGWLTAGTPRPYVHSLAAVGAVLALAALWPRRRALLLGTAAGFATHIWRDLSENGSGVSLLWPLSNRAFTLPHLSYLLAMAGVVLLDAALIARRRGPATATAPEAA